MLKRNKSWSTLFLKYFLSYILVFLLPLIVLGYMIYKDAVSSLSDEIKTSNMEKISQVKNIVDIQMKGLENVASRISYDNKFTPFLMKHDLLFAKEAIGELSRYKANSVIVDELFLYYRNDDTIYSSIGQGSIDNLVSSFYKFENWSKEQFINDINSVTRPIVRPADTVEIWNEKKRYLTCLYPIPHNSLYSNGTVLFMINEFVLSNFIDNILGSFEGYAYIIDENNSILSSKIKSENIQSSEDLFNMIVKLGSSGLYSINYKGKEYSVCVAKSDYNSWRYITIIKSSQFFKRVVEKRNMVIVIFFTLIVLGTGVAGVLSINSYKPIKNIVEYMYGNLNQFVKRNERNELNVIRETIDKAMCYSKSLEKRIENQRPMVREQIFINLLRGRYREDDVNNNGSFESELRMFRERFAVILLVPDANNTSETDEYSKDDLIYSIENIDFDAGKLYCVELINDNSLAVIVNMDRTDNEKAKLNMLANSIIGCIHDNIGIEYVASIGKIYDKIGDVAKSYIEALAAMEYRLNGTKMIFFDDIIDQQEKLQWYPMEEQIRFIQCLKQGDAELANSYLKILIKSIGEKQMSILMLKCICFDIINSVLKAFNHLDINDYAENISRLMKFGNLNQLEERMYELTTRICKHINSQKDSKNIALRDGILRYVNMNYKNYELSLEQIAKHHNVSASYLSKFFKEQVGSNFIEYVSKLRIEEVKRLLSATDKPIKDIVKIVGYEDISQFAKKFKKEEGITPARYRELHTNQ